MTSRNSEKIFSNFKMFSEFPIFSKFCFSNFQIFKKFKIAKSFPNFYIFKNFKKFSLNFYLSFVNFLNFQFQFANRNGSYKLLGFVVAQVLCILIVCLLIYSSYSTFSH